MKKSNYKKPSSFIFGIIKIATWFMNTFVYNLKVERNDLKGQKPARRVIVCNHEAKIDFFGAFQAIPGKAHFVVSNSFLRSLKIKPLMEMAGCIGKNQFQTSVTDLRTMKTVVDNDAQLVFYPAGLMTESGMSTPIPNATGKALKWLDADVYVAKINGSYLTNPKWSTKKRKGKITLNLYKLYDRNELSALSVEEVHERVCSELDFNAYTYNQERKIEFKNGDLVEGLENVLYKCPHCNEEFSIKAKNNRLFCEKCGYSVISDKFGKLHQNGEIPLIYSLPCDWHAFIEGEVRKEIETEGFVLETDAEVYKINDKKHCYEYAGAAKIKFDKENFYINGTLYGEEINKTIYAGVFPILPFVPGKSFEIQDGNDIFRICPKNPEMVMKWIFAVKTSFALKNHK